MKLFNMKYIIALLLSVGTYFLASKYDSIEEYSTFPEQKEAFEILVQKCNVCHAVQNPNKVFTIENMNGFARKINRQVFVWKRMPKGNEIKLSEAEKETIKKWLNIQLKK